MESFSDSELDATGFTMDITKELIIKVYSRHMPDKIKPNKNNKLRKLPFESIMYDKYEAGAHCVNFRITKPRIISWVWAIINYHETIVNDNPEIMMDVKHFNEKGLEVDTKNGEETVMKVQIQLHKWAIDDPEHLITVHLHLTQGTCMMQGKMYTEWAEKHFRRILQMANEFTEYQKERKNYKHTSQSTPKQGKRRSKRLMNHTLNVEQKDEETEPKSHDAVDLHEEGEKSMNEQIQDTCVHLDSSVGELVQTVSRFETESRDQENRMNNQFKLLQDLIKVQNDRVQEIDTKLRSIETQQGNILREIKGIKTANKKGNENVTADDENWNAVTNKLDNIAANINQIITDKDNQTSTCIDAIKKQFEDMKINKPDINTEKQKRVPEHSGSRTKDFDKRKQTKYKEKSGLSINYNKTKLILSDSQFSAIDSANIGPNTDIRSCGNADIQDWIDILEQTETYIHIDHVLFHCGINERTGVQKNTKEKVNSLVNTLEEKFPRAKIHISAVLPTRDNKNVIQIGELNDLYEDVCLENQLTFVDFTDSLKDKDGYINRSLYSSPVHFNIDGQMLMQANIAYALSEHHVPATTVLTPTDSGKKENDENKETEKDPKPDTGTEQKDNKDKHSEQKPKTGTSDFVEDKGNGFIAYARVVNNRSEFLQFKSDVLRQSEHNMKASHVMSAYRIRSDNGIEQRYEDDGERGAGYKLMNGLRMHGLVNVAVIALRWFTVHIGQARWQHISQCALDAMVDAKIIDPAHLTVKERHQSSKESHRDNEYHKDNSYNESHSRQGGKIKQDQRWYTSDYSKNTYYRTDWNQSRPYNSRTKSYFRKPYHNANMTDQQYPRNAFYRQPRYNYYHNQQRQWQKQNMSNRDPRDYGGNYAMDNSSYYASYDANY